MKFSVGLAALGMGFLFGAGVTWVAIDNEWLGETIEVDGWRSDLKLGAANASPLTRAVVAKTGLFALNKSEAVYFFRSSDEKGERLREDCTYRLSGEGIPASWWSITLYADDNFLPVNEDEAHSFTKTLVPGAPGGAWTARISAERPEEGQWISSKNSGAPILVIRLYVPQPAVLSNPQKIQLPDITRLHCMNEKA